MRLALQDLVDHAGAGGAGTHFEKQPYAVGVGGADDAGEVERLHRLADDGVGGAFAGEVVRFAERTAVKADVWWRGCIEQMQFAIGGFNGFGDFTVNGGDALQRMRAAAEFAGERFDGDAITADDTFTRGVDDQQVDAGFVFEGVAHLIFRAIEYGDGPIDFFTGLQIPGTADGIVIAGEIAFEECRCVHAFEHGIARRPGAGGEEAGGFTEAVTDDRRWLDTEAAHQIADHRAEPDLREDGIAMADLTDRFVGPVLAERELRRETIIFGVKTAEDLRPLRGKLTAHAGKRIARAGEDKCDWGGWAKRFGIVKETVTGDGAALLNVLPGEKDRFVQLDHIAGDDGQAACCGGGAGMLRGPIPGEGLQDLHRVRTADRFSGGGGIGPQCGSYISRRRFGKLLQGVEVGQ